VATTSVVAQMIAGRNGRNIQKHAAINPVTKKTASVVRVRSPRTSIPSVWLNGGLLGRLTCASSAADGGRRGRENNAAVLARPSGDRYPMVLEFGFRVS
jgi:hypothetical protein